MGRPKVSTVGFKRDILASLLSSSSCSSTVFSRCPGTCRVSVSFCFVDGLVEDNVEGVGCVLDVFRGDGLVATVLSPRLGCGFVLLALVLANLRGGCMIV
jgi:hypothetical protein